jgi:hypothetical protein
VGKKGLSYKTGGNASQFNDSGKKLGGFLEI